MSKRNNLDSRLTRRSWIVLATSALAGCGGGGSSGGSTASAPGTGGTGIYAQGSISGVGSVIMNSIKFDDTLATVQLDGQIAQSSQLRLGMVAGVQGLHNDVDITLGTANSIEVWSIAQGPVTQGGATPGGNGNFTVAGMTINSDLNTVFEGVSASSPLSLGQNVTVWGLQAGTNLQVVWTATRVEVTSVTPVVSTGLVSVTNSLRSINGLALTGPTADGLTAGDLVRVQGALSSDGKSIAVASAKLQNPGTGVSHQSEVEIEGLVTAVQSAVSFTLGNISVDASKAVFSPLNTAITLGSHFEVYGTWLSGVLVASKVLLESELVLQEVEITARIDQYTSVADFVVRGQRCDATGVTVSHGTVADLKVGAMVKVKGTKAGDVLKVTELELEA